MFLNPLSHAFGLDIGDLSVKIVRLRNRSYASRHPKFAVDAYRATELPPGLIVNGELIQPEEIRKHILALLAGGKKERSIHGHWVVASIPESQSVITLVHTDRRAESLSSETIQALAAKHVPFEEGSYYLDWQIIPREDENSSDDRARILLGATPKKIANSYTYLLESLGLGVIALEIESVAIVRAMITAQKDYDGEARIILDVGATGTSAIVFDHDTIQFSTSLPFSGELLTTAIAQKKNLQHEEAEKNKKQQGLSSATEDASVARLVDDLKNGIKKTIDFYYSHVPDYHPITRITLSGGGALMKELPGVLKEGLGIETACGNPWKNLTASRALAACTEELRYATAIGLALRAADNPLLIHDSV